MSSEEKKARWKQIKTPVYIIFFIVFLVLFSLTTFGPIVRLYDYVGNWTGFMPTSQLMILISAWGMAAAITVLYFIERHYLGKK